MSEPFKTDVKKIGGSYYALIPSWYLKANEVELYDEQKVLVTLDTQVEEQTNG